MGGFTGASGRGGISVRRTTGGGGVDAVGWPSASKNLRMRSSSDSAGARGIGFSVLGAGFDVGSVSSVFVLLAALASNCTNNATAMSRRKMRFSK